MASQKMVYDTPSVLSTNTFTLTDYIFGGWNGIFYSNNTEKDTTNDLYSGNKEFVQYVDLAPYFNKYGTNRKYHMELDLRPEAITGSNNNIKIYFQNSSSTRYAFKTIDGVTANEKVVNFTSTDYKHVSFDFEVRDSKLTDTAAMLAFYGIYDSGRKPIIKNVRISLLPEVNDGDTVTNLTENSNITMYAKWKKLLYTNDTEKKHTDGTRYEFMRYEDLAPYIDANGADSIYNLEFDIKSEDITNKNIITVYFQNGSNTRYQMKQKSIEVTTEYQHVSFDFVPYRSIYDVNQAYLAFFGTYNTGNNPVVKNVRLYVYKDHQ